MDFPWAMDDSDFVSKGVENEAPFKESRVDCVFDVPNSFEGSMIHV